MVSWKLSLWKKNMQYNSHIKDVLLIAIYSFLEVNKIRKKKEIITFWCITKDTQN